ncbi:hypothetical protein Gpo141_00013514, partial [Globisporangium polare]
MPIDSFTSGAAAASSSDSPHLGLGRRRSFDELTGDRHARSPRAAVSKSNSHLTNSSKGSGTGLEAAGAIIRATYRALFRERRRHCSSSGCMGRLASNTVPRNLLLLVLVVSVLVVLRMAASVDYAPLN